jgi:two-component system, chemotaxis family, sensor kinase CheA
VDMSRYLDLFVQEATEHLEALGRDLLAMEREGALAAVDAAFRHAHSIKGMAASMGFTPIADLAHHLEDLLDLARRRQASLDPDAVDAALAVADGLSTLVSAAAEKRALEEAGVDVPALLARLTAVREAEGGAKPTSSSGVQAAGDPAATTAAASPAPAENAPQGPARARSQTPFGGPRPHLKITVTVAGTSKVPGVRGFLVHKRLSSLGEILSCDPPLADLKSGRLPKGRLEIVLESDVGEASVSAELGTISELDAIEVETVAVPATLPGGLEAAATPPGQATPTETVRTVRIRTDLLDGFMDGVGELLLASDRLRELAADSIAEGPSPLEEALDRLGRIVKGLHRQVMATRMTPLSTVTDRLPRVVRETVRRVGKEATLEVEGAEIELDRAILDEIESPLGHLIRNCVDHGIEAPEDRREASKPAAGLIRLRARRDRDRVVIEVSDDGRGFDVDHLKAKAVGAGLLDEAAASQMSTREALMLACHPGLSTAAAISEVSGRGVGMDVVKATVESLGGSLEIDSVRGEGSLFIMVLPLTVAIQRLLLVGVGGEVFGVPVNKVLHVLDVEKAHRTSTRGRPMVPYLDALVPAHALPELLDLPGADVDPVPHVVVESQPGKAVALAVDRLAGQLEGVVRPLGRPLDLIGGLSGLSLLPDGRPIVVLDLASLLRSAESGGAGIRWTA